MRRTVPALAAAAALVAVSVAAPASATHEQIQVTGLTQDNPVPPAGTSSRPSSATPAPGCQRARRAAARGRCAAGTRAGSRRR